VTRRAPTRHDLRRVREKLAKNLARALGAAPEWRLSGLHAPGRGFQRRLARWDARPALAPLLGPRPEYPADWRRQVERDRSLRKVARAAWYAGA
jgi:hypothetical protein